MRRLWDSTGQILLVAVLMFLAIIITVPVLIFVNQHATRHSAQSQTRLKGRTVAEEGVAFGIQQLNLPNMWPYITGGGLPPAGVHPSVQGGGASLISVSSFSVTYSSAPYPGLENYQVGILAKPIDRFGKVVPGSSVLTIVSKRTVGVKLPTGLSTGAALHMGLIPVFGGQSVAVNWGPLVIYDPTTTWKIPDVSPTPNPSGGNHPMNGCQYPRKFSAGGLTCFSYPTIDHAYPLPYTTNPGASLVRCPNSASDPDCKATTDNKEYWAFADLGFPIVLDEPSYINTAQTETGIAPPQCYLSAGGPPFNTPDGPPLTPGNATYPCLTAPFDCGYFDAANCPVNTPPDVVVFGTPNPPGGTFYTVPNPSNVIYVKGNADLKNTNMEFKGVANAGGAFIVTGDLYIDETDVNALALVQTTLTDIRTPPTSELDDPWRPCGWPFPPLSVAPGSACATCAGAACNTTSITDIGAGGFGMRGFLWVQGNFFGSSAFNMTGVVRIDKTLTQAPGVGVFGIFYDDEINRKIRVSNLDLQVDSTASIP